MGGQHAVARHMVRQGPDEKIFEEWWQCARCATHVDPADRYCRNCGSHLEPEVIPLVEAPQPELGLD